MSVDPAVSAALLNLCAQLQDGTTANTTTTAAPSTDAAPTTGTTTTTAAAPRPASDYEWLRGVLASVEAPEKKVKKLLFQMEKKSLEGKKMEVGPEEWLEGLEELSDMVEDINWAAEFTLMQGPQRVLAVLQEEGLNQPLTSVTGNTPNVGRAEESAALASAEGDKQKSMTDNKTCASLDAAVASIPVLTQLAMIVAHSAQSNAPVQAAYQTAHWESILVPLLRGTVEPLQLLKAVVRTPLNGGSSEEISEEALGESTALMKLVAALLHACSCLCRECPPNTIVFIQHGGLPVIAEMLSLTRTITCEGTAADSNVDSSSDADNASPNITVKTTIHSEANTPLTDEVKEADAPLRQAASKVTIRAFFFVAYLASSGVSSAELIVLLCQHAEGTADYTVQKAAARALLELFKKSPKAVKEAVHAHMPKRLYEWKHWLQRTEGDGAEVLMDERQEFVDALKASS